jgi:xylose isomerase
VLCILGMGELTPGGIKFDAKGRCANVEPVDLFHAHVGGIDAFACRLKISKAIQADGRLSSFIKERYR